MEKKFTSENFEAEVLKSEKPVLVDFYADWCGPCKMMAPAVEALANERSDRWKAECRLCTGACPRIQGYVYSDPDSV